MIQIFKFFGGETFNKTKHKKQSGQLRLHKLLHAAQLEMAEKLDSLS